MFEEKIVKANEEIKKVTDYLKEHEEAFQSMNLKLYDAFYYFMSDEMKKDFPLTYTNNETFNDYTDFDWFCEDSYRLFEEDLKENYGIDFSVMQYRIGRTSSFYLCDNTVDGIIKLDKNSNINTNYTIYCFVDYFCNNNYGNSIRNISNGKVIIFANDDDIDDITNELDYIIDDLYNDVVNYCKNIITVYDIIKDFKDNQVEYFKEYLEIQEERLQEEKEEEEKNRKRK